MFLIDLKSSKRDLGEYLNFEKFQFHSNKLTNMSSDAELEKQLQYGVL